MDNSMNPKTTHGQHNHNWMTQKNKTQWKKKLKGEIQAENEWIKVLKIVKSNVKLKVWNPSWK